MNWRLIISQIYRACQGQGHKGTRTQCGKSHPRSFNRTWNLRERTCNIAEPFAQTTLVSWALLASTTTWHFATSSAVNLLVEAACPLLVKRRMTCWTLAKCQYRKCMSLKDWAPQALGNAHKYWTMQDRSNDPVTYSPSSGKWCPHHGSHNKIRPITPVSKTTTQDRAKT